MGYVRFVMAAACFVAAGAACGRSIAGEAEVLGFRMLQLDGKPVRWAGSEAPVIVTYAFIDKVTYFRGARNCSSMQSPEALLRTSRIDRPKFESEVRAAFDMWEKAAGITFQESKDPGAAGIVIGAQLEGDGHAFANVDYRSGTGSERIIERSLVCLNPDLRWKVGFGGSLAVYDIRYTIAHEIGHAIGLDHPASRNQLMSFNYAEKFRDLQEGDVEGALRIYGAPQTSPGGFGPITSANAPKTK